MIQATTPTILKNNIQWVIKELNVLLEKWNVWLKETDHIADQPFDINTQFCFR